MKIDIQIPKHVSGKTLYTLAPSLTAEQIAGRNPAWYAPDALRYDDCLLIDDWDNGTKILDARYRYLTMDDMNMAEKYLSVFYRAVETNDLLVQQEAYSICGLLLRTRFSMNSKIHNRLKEVVEKFHPFDER